VGFLLKEAIGYTRQWEIDLPTTMLEENTFPERLQGRLSFTRTSQGIWVDGTLTGTSSAECARCLVTFAFTLKIKLEELFYYPPSSISDPADYIITEDGLLDLVEPVREQIVLNIPMSPLCKPDCRGFCSHCGENLNLKECHCKDELVDPRLAALRDFLSDD
jgi:uncharacterized protein